MMHQVSMVLPKYFGAIMFIFLAPTRGVTLSNVAYVTTPASTDSTTVSFTTLGDPITTVTNPNQFVTLTETVTQTTVPVTTPYSIENKEESLGEIVVEDNKKASKKNMMLRKYRFESTRNRLDTSTIKQPMEMPPDHQMLMSAAPEVQEMKKDVGMTVPLENAWKLGRGINQDVWKAAFKDNGNTYNLWKSSLEGKGMTSEEHESVLNTEVNSNKSVNDSVPRNSGEGSANSAKTSEKAYIVWTVGQGAGANRWTLDGGKGQGAWKDEKKDKKGGSAGVWSTSVKDSDAIVSWNNEGNGGTKGQGSWKNGKKERKDGGGGVWSASGKDRDTVVRWNTGVNGGAWSTAAGDSETGTENTASEQPNDWEEGSEIPSEGEWKDEAYHEEEPDNWEEYGDAGEWDYSEGQADDTGGEWRGDPHVGSNRGAQVGRNGGAHVGNNGGVVWNTKNEGSSGNNEEWIEEGQVDNLPGWYAENHRGWNTGNNGRWNSNGAAVNRNRDAGEWKVYDADTMDDTLETSWKVVGDGGSEGWKLIDDKGDVEWVIQNVNGEWKVKSAEEFNSTAHHNGIPTNVPAGNDMTIKTESIDASVPQTTPPTESTAPAITTVPSDTIVPSSISTETPKTPSVTNTPTSGWNADEQGRYVIWKINENGKGEAKVYGRNGETQVWTVGDSEAWWKGDAVNENGESGWTIKNPSVGDNDSSSYVESLAENFGSGSEGEVGKSVRSWKLSGEAKPWVNSGTGAWSNESIKGSGEVSGGKWSLGEGNRAGAWKGKTTASWKGRGRANSSNNGGITSGSGWRNKNGRQSNGNKQGYRNVGLKSNAKTGSGWKSDNGGSSSAYVERGNKSRRGWKNPRSSSGRNGGAWNGKSGRRRKNSGDWRNKRGNVARGSKGGNGQWRTNGRNKVGDQTNTGNPWSSNNEGALPYIIVISKQPDAGSKRKANGNPWTGKTTVNRRNGNGIAKGVGRKPTNKWKMNNGGGSSGWQWNMNGGRGSWKWVDGWMGSGGGFGGWVDDKGTMYSKWKPVNSNNKHPKVDTETRKKSASKMVFVFTEKQDNKSETKPTHDAEISLLPPRASEGLTKPQKGKQIIIIDYTAGEKMKTPKGEKDMKKEIRSIITTLKSAKPLNLKGTIPTDGWH